MLGCECLNVTIEVGEDDFQKVERDCLSDEEKQDKFFGQELKQVTKLLNINKLYSGLIQTRNVGSWVVHYCINCEVHTHAVHREKGASCILVNSKLLTTEAIQSLKSSKHYSTLYNIIVNVDNVSDEDGVVNSYLPNDVESHIKVLKQIASDTLKDETSAVQERIRIYTDQQYNELDKLRQRAFREQQALSRIIINNNTADKQLANSTNTAMADSPASATGVPSRLNEPLDAGSVTPSATNARHTPKRQKSCPAPHISSLDIDGVFEFEGIDDTGAQTEETEESDVDEGAKDDESREPRHPLQKDLGMAKSLPVTIPAFLSQTRNRFKDEDDLEDLEDPIMGDIAASMKAITKSLHSSTIFGDLPRPRYSTHI